ncbi:hypothetical protein MG293_001647 [Ovis ammon polii]|uniref:Uncharacterized protein n=1 Tax=Ovis ammon polii TaxID=230172 RepID=A0AAD4UMP1_OVIAM|nr:hypothetical protein MG293_001647 [Ovis ammon polii]
MQGTCVPSRSRKIPYDVEQLSPCATATEPICCNCRARTLELVLHSKGSHATGSLCTATREKPTDEKTRHQRNQVFSAVRAFLQLLVSKGYSLVVVPGFLTVVASPVAEHRFYELWLLGSGAVAQ